MDAVTKAKSFKALSALLSYPTEDLKAAMPEIRGVIEGEGVVPLRDRKGLASLIEDLETRELYDAQERYCLLFDRSRSLSLHLFEHVHGESRDRGQAMVDLAAHYERHGFVIAAKELPDFLPLFLEFLSLLPLEEARALLAEPAEILRELEGRLGKRQSPYAAVFRVLVALAKVGRAAGKPDAAGVAPDDETGPEDLEALDAEWEETTVSFGPGDPAQDACSRDRLMTRLRAAARSVVQPRAE